MSQQPFWTFIYRHASVTFNMSQFALVGEFAPHLQMLSVMGYDSGFSGILSFCRKKAQAAYKVKLET